MNTHKHNNQASEHEPENNFLVNTSKKNVFSTPQNYFEQLPVDISSKISSSTSSKSYSNIFSRKFAMAAVLIAVALFAGGYFILTKEITTVQNYQALLYDDILHSGVVDDMDDELLYEYFIIDNPDGELMDPSDEDFNQYRNYLLEENIEVTLITNEL